MELSSSGDVAALQQMTMNDLRTRYAEVFGEQASSKNRAWILKRLAWRLQALAEGGLSERARRRAAELAADADFRLNPPPALASNPPTEEPAVRTTAPTPNDERLPPVGAVLIRPYKGRVVEVSVASDGFAYEGQVYPSLSAAAKAVTGSHTNGFLFFRKALQTTRGRQS